MHQPESIEVWSSEGLIKVTNIIPFVITKVGHHIFLPAEQAQMTLKLGGHGVGVTEGKGDTE